MLDALSNLGKNPYRGTMLFLVAVVGYFLFGTLDRSDMQVWMVLTGLVGLGVLGAQLLNKTDPFFAERRRKRELPYQMWLASLIPIREALTYLDKADLHRLEYHHREAAGHLIQRVADHLDEARVPHPPVETHVKALRSWMDRLRRLETWCGWANPEGYELAKSEGDPLSS